MDRWPRDEDEYLTYMAKVMARLNRDDPPPTPEDNLKRYTRNHWIDLLCEAVSEADPDFHAQLLLDYEDGDALAMGERLAERIKTYSRQCAITWGVIDD